MMIRRDWATHNTLTCAPTVIHPIEPLKMQNEASVRGLARE